MKISKKKIAIICIVLVIIALVTCEIIFGLKYFFHRSVVIETEYDISDITINQPDYGIQKTVNAKKFTHYASYGRIYYRFDLSVNGKNIPVEISVFKTDNHAHDNARLVICQGDSDSEIKVDVYNYIHDKNSKPWTSETYIIDDTDEIVLSVGP